METQFYVYVHCKPSGEIFYVGKGKDRRSVDFHGRNAYHKNVVAKYGQENIGVYIFACDSEREALDDEARWIAQLRSDGTQLANIADNGLGCFGWKASIEQRARMSLRQIGNKHHLGHKASAETRAKMSAARTPEMMARISAKTTGLKRSEESRARMTKAQIGNQHWIGKKHSAQTKTLMSESQKGKRNALGCTRSVETKRKMSEARTRWWDAHR